MLDGRSARFRGALPGDDRVRLEDHFHQALPRRVFGHAVVPHAIGQWRSGDAAHERDRDLIARGDLLARQGRVREARESYEKAGRVDPYRAAGLSAARLEALKKQAPGP